MLIFLWLSHTYSGKKNPNEFPSSRWPPQVWNIGEELIEWILSVHTFLWIGMDTLQITPSITSNLATFVWLIYIGCGTSTWDVRETTIPSNIHKRNMKGILASEVRGNIFYGNAPLGRSNILHTVVVRLLIDAAINKFTVCPHLLHLEWRMHIYKCWHQKLFTGHQLQ